MRESLEGNLPVSTWRFHLPNCLCRLGGFTCRGSGSGGPSGRGAPRQPLKEEEFASAATEGEEDSPIFPPVPGAAESLVSDLRSFLTRLEGGRWGRGGSCTEFPVDMVETLARLQRAVLQDPAPAVSEDRTLDEVLEPKSPVKRPAERPAELASSDDDLDSDSVHALMDLIDSTSPND